VLIECDPSIKAIIIKIDEVNHEYIVEDLDDQHLVIKEGKLQELKMKLDDVRVPAYICAVCCN
jgi:TFIIH basal transcription factor complex TTD-A subunit